MTESVLMSAPRERWIHALRRRDVWARALAIGLPVGIVQVAVNQGDHWLAGRISGVLVLKSVASPCLSTGIALVSAALSLGRHPAPPARAVETSGVS